MQELLAQSSFDKLKEGAIVPGTITEVRQNEVVVDIGGKSEGVIPANEFIDIGDLQIGSTIEVLVEKLEDRDGSPILSFDKAEQKKNWDNILTKFPEGSVATGRVKAKVKGGLIIIDRRRRVHAGLAHRRAAPEEPGPVRRPDLRLQGPQDQPRAGRTSSFPAAS